MSRPNKQNLRFAYNLKMSHLAEIAAKRMKQARLNAGLTQAELADALGLSRDAISKIENNRSTLTLKHLEALPRILNQPITYFLDLQTDLDLDEVEILELFRGLPHQIAKDWAKRALRSLLQALHEQGFPGSGSGDVDAAD